MTRYCNKFLSLRKHLKICTFSLQLLTNVKRKHLVLITIVLLILYVAGILPRLFEKDFQNLKYPYDGDVEKLVLQLRNKQVPSVKPINLYNYSYITNSKQKCDSIEQLRLVFIIKSAPEHFNRRAVIRKTWGYESRYSDVEVRTVFLLGIVKDVNLQKFIQEEYTKFTDIVQANFTDAYFNNTIKTMMGFKWAVTFCPNSKFYMFVDDDMYVSAKNVFRFLRHPTKYPDYLNNQSVLLSNVLLRNKRQLDYFELPDSVKLYIGYVKRVAPLRDLFSKWYVTLEEYPYNYYPLYATAGAYIVSLDALLDLYYASFYTKHFRFDDVYLGLVALKAGIEPHNTDYIYLSKKKYSAAEYMYVIACHGYGNPEELLKIWSEQKELGNA